MNRLAVTITLFFSAAACGSSSASDVADAAAADATASPDAMKASAVDAAAPVADADTTGQVDLNRYFPMAIGAKWTYKVNNKGVIGTKVQEVLGYEDVGGLKAGVMAYKVQSNKPSGKKTISWQKDDGFSLVRHREHTFAANGSQETEEFYLPGKLRLDETSAHTVLGASYHYIYTEKVHDFVLAANTSLLKDEVWTVEAVDFAVTVPAGTFNCMQLHKTNASTGSDKRYWFAKGVGKVKEQSANQTEELVSFQFP